ncbi:DUF4232 domain-containing protein [Streptomyces sp. NPDC050636]|uniref:DUF4232 domain-containing protein n=1 Tax=Streptomyces sp. NPDC050636 TaxID=3154510 RepID=UPI003435FE10
MTASRSRRRSAAYAALALALCGSLALTGCNSKSKKSKKTSSSSSSKSKKHKIIGGGGAAAGAGAGAASRRTTTCLPSTYKVRFSQIANPKDHVIVKFANSSSRPCRLYDGPLLRFNNAAKPLPLVKGDQTLGTSITVPPKGSAYAVIPTTTAATKGTKKKTVRVTFMGGVDDSDTSPNMSADIEFGTGQGHNSLPISVGNSKVTNWNFSIHGANLEAGL